MALPFHVGYRSVPGSVHSYQDRILVDRDRALFAVADGLTLSMGGDGGVAAGRAIDILRKEFDGDLVSAFEMANSRIVGLKAGGLKIGETTITAAVIDIEKKLMTVANIGDSPAYYLRRDRLTRLYIPDVGPMGGISQTIGYDPSITAHKRTLRLLPGDLISIASDGVNNILNRRDLGNAVRDSQSMSAAVDFLIKLSQDRPKRYDDDKSLILIGVGYPSTKTRLKN